MKSKGAKTTFFCKNCGAQSAKWIGKCPSCNEWNTYIEEVVQREEKSAWKKSVGFTKVQKPQLVAEISADQQARINTHNGEFNRVLGGGLVSGSLVLVGGEPGIGKSTLMLQVALQMKNQKVLYVSGEESEQQLKMRADRLGLTNAPCYILNETSTSNIFTQIAELSPSMVVIDSIQTLHTDSIDSSAGSISQIKECAAELQKYAKQSNVPVFIIGHITKDGSIAGPKLLEHMVDTVLQFEGDRNHGYRILRSIKNRFGSTSELGIYEMQSTGLREVPNPSEILLSQRDEQFSGTAIAATIEGARPMLIEIQALVSSAAYGTPQRLATGFDLRRLNMLLAVLEKRCGFKLSAKDVFLNIAGGIRVDDPAIDLAVVAAILSSNSDIAVSPRDCFAAEVGLTGEIRPVTRIEQRLAEAEKLGFERIFISKYNLKGPSTPLRTLDVERSRDASAPANSKIKIVPVSGMYEVFSELFG
ncbi:MAG: DNA repair protein RadA [Bacteroidales bacterium]|nr:DNA repair protein RadA [Bacteroidales bacterium]